MTAIEIARRMLDLGQAEEAKRAYTIALQQQNLEPQEELEAASCIFFARGDYKISFTVFVSLYNRGLFQEEIMQIMTAAFYKPNESSLEKFYNRNCKLLAKYPYFFEKEFPDFVELPIQFFPFDDNGFVPYYREEKRFGDYINFNETIIDRYFFKDLDKPILADDVYSQYQLEYLYDNVRKSEWVARDNHIYLHYTNWMSFCAYLQCLDLRRILKDEKFVFLMDEDIKRYPIDFKKEYGIDYSQYTVQPIGVREVNRLIWHTQLSSDNGGDFFNEILYGHPNLLAIDSLIFDSIDECIKEGLKDLQKRSSNEPWSKALYKIDEPTEKDVLVSLFLHSQEWVQQVDPNSRIAPALLLQPHFNNRQYSIKSNANARICILDLDEYNAIHTSPVFKQFKYIKTFTPMRRLTTSYAASVRYCAQQIAQSKEKKVVSVDCLQNGILNHSYLIDKRDRLYSDSVLVRFEDGKLNPKATFRALAEFLDIPYTESMTYCSGKDGLDPLTYTTNVRGFDPATVYRTYDAFCNDAERALIEYLSKDVYKAYGYDFHYYKGEKVDEKWIEEHIDGAVYLNELLESSYRAAIYELLRKDKDEEEAQKLADTDTKEFVYKLREKRLSAAKMLSGDMRFVNKEGQPLCLMPLLKLNEKLLEQPLYR